MLSSLGQRPSSGRRAALPHLRATPDSACSDHRRSVRVRSLRASGSQPNPATRAGRYSSSAGVRAFTSDLRLRPPEADPERQGESRIKPATRLPCALYEVSAARAFCGPTLNGPELAGNLPVPSPRDAASLWTALTAGADSAPTSAMVDSLSTCLVELHTELANPVQPVVTCCASVRGLKHSADPQRRFPTPGSVPPYGPGTLRLTNLALSVRTARGGRPGLVLRAAQIRAPHAGSFRGGEAVNN